MNYKIYILFIGLYFCNSCLQAKSMDIVHLDENNWHYILKEEWLVQFYAPWCPACQSLTITWDKLAKSSQSLGISIGKIDVTQAPALSGRFFVTALPTIYHVINGEFRQYRGSRDWNSLQEFILKKNWKNIETISSWKQPDSIQMSIVAYFFKLSHYLKELTNVVNEQYGFPMWVTYGIFAIGTVLLGALLGLCFVCIVDVIFPAKGIHRKSFAEVNAEDKENSNKDDIEDDLDETSVSDEENQSESEVKENDVNVKQQKSQKSSDLRKRNKKTNER